MKENKSGYLSPPEGLTKANSRKDASIEDRDLIRQIRSGRVEVYGIFVRRYHKRVLGSCLYLLNNLTDAEEAAQDIFVKAYQSMDKFNGYSSFSTWLYRITANHCLDILRWRARQKTSSLEALVAQNQDQIQSIFAASDRTASSFENRELVQKILATLPPECRTILILRELEGLEFSEIARILDCTLTAVRGRLARARRKLQENLGPFLASEGDYSRMKTLKIKWPKRTGNRGLFKAGSDGPEALKPPFRPEVWRALVTPRQPAVG